MTNKFSAVKTESHGIVFDSKAEARRYSELMLLQRDGHIAGLTRQVPFVLAPSVKLLGDKRARPPVRIIVDFCYSDPITGSIVFEDTKGFDTPMGRMKRHLLKAIHGIDVKLTK